MSVLYEAIFDWDKRVGGIGFGLGAFGWTYVGTFSVERDETVVWMVLV